MRTRKAHCQTIGYLGICNVKPASEQDAGRGYRDRQGHQAEFHSSRDFMAFCSRPLAVARTSRRWDGSCMFAATRRRRKARLEEVLNLVGTPERGGNTEEPGEDCADRERHQGTRHRPGRLVRSVPGAMAVAAMALVARRSVTGVMRETLTVRRPYRAVPRV